MWKKMISFLIVFLILGFFTFFGYLIVSRYFLPKKTEIKSEDIKLSEKKVATKEEDWTTKTIIEKEQTLDEVFDSDEEKWVVNKKLLTQVVQKLNLSGWKETVIPSYKKDDSAKNVNDYQLDDFAIQTDSFERMVLEQIAKKINFADLVVTFTYYQGFKQVKIKVAFKAREDIFATINYQLLATKD